MEEAPFVPSGVSQRLPLSHHTNYHAIGRGAGRAGSRVSETIRRFPYNTKDRVLRLYEC